MSELLAQVLGSFLLLFFLFLLLFVCFVAFGGNAVSMILSIRQDIPRQFGFTSLGYRRLKLNDSVMGL